MWKAGDGKELGVYRSVKRADVAGTGERAARVVVRLQN